MVKKNAVRVTPSTGNVFRDRGCSKEESEHLLVRAAGIKVLPEYVATDPDDDDDDDDDEDSNEDSDGQDEDEDDDDEDDGPEEGSGWSD